MPDPNAHDDTVGRHGPARLLAERAIAAQNAGDEAEADRLFAEAARIDPDAVTAALDAAVVQSPAAATRPQNDDEIAAMSRTVEPHSDAPDRTNIGGSGSGADQQGI